MHTFSTKILPFLVLFVSIICLVALPIVDTTKTCVPKHFPTAQEPGALVCVCNATYCDEFPPLGTLDPGQAAVYTSSVGGKRFERTTLAFQAATVSGSGRIFF
jgi:hypothetical protein